MQKLLVIDDDEDISAMLYLLLRSRDFEVAVITRSEDIFEKKLFDIINPQLIQPDLLIYLHAPVSKLKENIKKRNRSYEQAIDPEYLFTLQETYTQYIKQHNIKTLFIDASKSDFIANEEHLKAVIDALDKDYEHGQHYLTLS